MVAETAPILDQLNEPDPRLETARKRQAAVWNQTETDFLPLLCEASGQPWDGPDYALTEQVDDPTKMLHEGLVVVGRQLPVASDSVLSIRPQFGVGTLCTPFGCEYELSAKYGSPWVTGHATKDYLSGLEPDDINFDDSLIPWVCEVTRKLREGLAGRVPVFMADTQGPFDIAHQARGHDLLTDIYDDPPFVHHVMELALHVYIESSRRFKEALGEPDSSGHHSGNLYMENCGVRLCDDSGVMMPPKALDEFILPYHQRALAAFGGGWVHFCGDARQLFDGYVEIPEVRAINFGQPEYYDPAEILSRLMDKGKLYYGAWPKAADESIDQYFGRLLGCLNGEKRGLMLMFHPGGGRVPETMDRWHEAHGRAGL